MKIKNLKEPSHFSMLESKLRLKKTETENLKVAEMVEYQNLLPVPFQV